MATRRHLIATHGVPAEVWQRFMSTPGEQLGSWRFSAAASVWGTDGATLDHWLGLATRTAGGLALRATTVDDDYAVLVFQHAGRRVLMVDHPFGGLTPRDPTVDEEEAELEQPIPSERLALLNDGDDEVLARLLAGESPRAAWEATTTLRAERLVGLFRDVGISLDREQLIATLRGSQSERFDAPWGDLPQLLEVLGLTGLSAQLEAEPQREDDGDEEADDDRADNGTADACDDGEPSTRWSWRGRLGCAIGVAAMAGGALGGAVLASRFNSPLATIGGSVLGLLAAPLALLLLFLGRAGLSLLRLRRTLRRATENFHGECDPLRKTWIRKLPVQDVEPARRAIADWNELRRELGTAPSPGMFDLLYGDAILPSGPGARELLAALRAPGGVTTLGPRATELRLELLDRRLAGAAIDDLAQPLEALGR